MLPDALKENRVAAALETYAPDAVLGAKIEKGELAIDVAPDRIVEVCRFLKTDLQFVRLSGVTAVDWHPASPRFEVIYLLHSIERNQRVRLSCRPPGDPAEIDSVTPVWRGANWYEREVFDLFGIAFRNHPDLRRIMLPEEWEGYPLRKDYPVHGFKYSYQDE